MEKNKENFKKIKGHCPIPISKDVETSLDDLTCSLSMQDWSVLGMSAIVNEDGTRHGLELIVHFLRDSKTGLNTFRREAKPE